MSDIILPGIYTQEINSGPRNISAVQAGIIGLVGAAPRGPIDEVVPCSSYGEVERIYGPIQTGNDISEKANVLFNAGATQINCIRVTNGSPAKASITMNDSVAVPCITLTSKYEGVSGNQIFVDVTASTTGGNINMRIKDEFANIEEYYQTKNMLEADTGYLVNAINAASEIVVATKVSSENPAVADGYLAGGLDGTTPDATAIIGTTASGTGLKALEMDPTISILMTATGTDTAVWTEMLAQCNRTLDRICLFNLASGLTPAQAVSALSAYEGARWTTAYPGVKVYDYVTGSTKTISGSFVLGGILSKIPAYLSPSNQTVNGIVGLERQLSQSDMETLFQGRINPISVVYGAGIKMRSGITGASDPKWAQICKRRIMDKLQKSVKTSMSWAISQPNTGVLRDNVQSSVNGFLQSMVSGGEIGSSSVAVCGSSNNTPASIAAGYLICDVLVEFLYPADKIVFRYQEKLGEGGTK